MPKALLVSETPGPFRDSIDFAESQGVEVQHVSNTQAALRVLGEQEGIKILVMDASILQSPRERQATVGAAIKLASGARFITEDIRIGVIRTLESEDIEAKFPEGIVFWDMLESARNGVFNEKLGGFLSGERAQEAGWDTSVILASREAALNQTLVDDVSPEESSE